MSVKRKKYYYRIRAEAFWSTAACVLLLFAGVFFKDDIYERWLHSGGTENVAIEKMKSGLKCVGTCYLCGNSDDSLMDHYRKRDSIGLISINDWYVLDFRLDTSEAEEGYGSCESGNTGEIMYSLNNNFSGEMAAVEVILPEDYDLKKEKIQNSLCQQCLDKVVESLEVHKWKNERKKAVPLCLMDFQTLEIYSVQDWHKGCLIGDYWVDIKTEENQIEINAYKVRE